MTDGSGAHPSQPGPVPLLDVIASAEAESATLGALLHLRLEDALDLLDHLETEDFTDPRHRAVFDAAVALTCDGTPPDAVSVLGQLRRTGAERSMTADRSAAVFLADVAASAPAVVSAGHYARIVVEHRARRRIQEAAERLSQIVGTAALTDLLETATSEWGAVLEQFDRVLCRPGPVVQ